MLNKLILCAAILLTSICIINAQTVPTKVTKSLNKFYKGWKPARGFCEAKKWALTGDFDGNGRKDYLVRIKSKEPGKPTTLELIAFLSFDDGSYQPEGILSDPLRGEMQRSSFSVIKKGTKIQLGEGEGEVITLKTDAASQYICETDAVKTLIYEKGKWRNIYDN